MLEIIPGQKPRRKENKMIILFETVITLILIAGLYVITKHIIPDIKDEYNKIKQAEKEIKIAKQQFNYAEQDFVDVAIYKMKAAEERYNTLLKIERGKQERESNISM